jgi:ABC-2 type transport system permease protein
VSEQSSRDLGSAALVRLVARREISTRIRDKSFIVSSLVIVVLLLGAMGFQIAMSSGSDEVRAGLVGDPPGLTAALQAQGETLDVPVRVTRFDSEARARAAISAGDVDGVLVADSNRPELLVERSADGSLQAVVQGAVTRLSLTR